MVNFSFIKVLVQTLTTVSWLLKPLIQFIAVKSRYSSEQTLLTGLEVQQSTQITTQRMEMSKDFETGKHGPPFNHA